jgi:hypothetical protein
MRKSVSPHKAPIRVVIKDNLGADAPGASAPRACARPPWEGTCGPPWEGTCGPPLEGLVAPRGKGLVAPRGKGLAPRACARTNPPQLILYDNIYAIDHRYFSRR